MDQTVLGIVCGLLVMVGYGLDNAISQTPIKHLGPNLAIFYRGLFKLPFFALLLVFFWSTVTISWGYIFFTVIISLVGYGGLLAFYTALRHDKVGIVAPIGGTSVVFTVLFSFLFLAERLTMMQFFAVVVIVFSVFALSYRGTLNTFRFSSSLFSKGFLFAVVASFLWGIVFVLYKWPAMILGPVLTASLIELWVTVYAGIRVAALKERFVRLPRQIIPHLVVMSIAGGTALVFLNLGIRIYSVSIIAAMNACSPLVSALYGRFVYKERLTMPQWSAACLVVAGLVLISL